jgi:hypothetical protein
MNFRFLTLPTLLPALVLGSSLIALNFSALAFTPEESSTALVAVHKEVIKTQSIFTICIQKFPTTADANRKTLQDWKSRNRLQDYERVVASMGAKSPELKSQLEALNDVYVRRAAKFSASDLEKLCEGLPEIYTDEKYYRIPTDFASELEIIADLARSLDSKPAANPAPNTGSNPGSSTGANTGPNTGSNTTSSGPNGVRPNPGRYKCVIKRQQYSNYFDNPTTTVIGSFEFELFAKGEYVVYRNQKPVILVGKFTNPLDWPEFVGFYGMRENRVDWKSGTFTDYAFYGANDKAPDKRERRNGTFDNATGLLTLEWEDSGLSFSTTICNRTGNTQGKSATQLMTDAENPETYLQPKNVKAAKKPGTGGLNGVYVSSEGRPYNFLKNGYYLRGHYRWGYDQLDCTRATIPMRDGPFSSRICEPYSLRGNSITMAEETVSFQKAANGKIVVDDVVLSPVPANTGKPMNLNVKHVWSSTNGTSGAYGEETLELRNDGKFRYKNKRGGASYFAYGYGDTIAVTSKSGDGFDGTYKIFGYSIEFTYRNGLKLRYSFHSNPGFAGSYFFLGQLFTPDK